MEQIINSASNFFAAMYRFLPMPDSAPLNSATIAPITANVELIFNPVKKFGSDNGK